MKHSDKTPMQWDKLLCSRRDGDDKSDSKKPKRSPFLKDYDRIIFSSSFRRLGKKTQVHPHSFYHISLLYMRL